MARASWLKVGAGLSFFMAACQAVISHLVFLAAGIAYTVGTVVNWRTMKSNR